MRIENNMSRRRVSYDEGEKFAKENGLTFFETSCKTPENVREVSVGGVSKRNGLF